MSTAMNGSVPLTALPPMPRWVAWQTETREPGKPPTKVPYSPHGRGKAQADNPATWGDRMAAETLAAVLPKPFGIGGVGIELGDLGDGRALGGVDLDTCRSDGGAFSPWATKVIERFGSYTEISPSGTGAKVLFIYSLADLAVLREAMGTQHGKQWKRANGHDGAHPPSIELYIGNRYFAVTDERLAETPAELHQVDLDTLLWLIREAGPAFVGNGASGLFDETDPASDLPTRVEAATKRWPTLAKRWRGDWSDLKDGSRSGRAMSLCAVLKKAGFDRADMAAALALHVDTKEWTAQATARDLDRIFDKSDSKSKRQQTRTVNPSAEEAPEWAEDVQCDEKGDALANLANAMTALRSAPELCDCFAFDQMERTAILLKPLPKGRTDDLPRPVCDDDVGQVQEWLQRHELRRLGQDTSHQAVDLRAAENAFHPVQDYLKSLRWDRKPRLDLWLQTYLGAEVSPYTAAIGRMFPIAMIARIFEPGCKADYMLILEGLQGALKSTVGAILGGKWFSDSLPDIGSDAVRISQHLRGKWLVELSELSAMSKAETEELKSFITRREEQFTPKYGRREVKEPRQCVFIGTTNQAVYLRDQTGARRFWPVKVGTLNTDMLARDRDQLFAEAVHLYRGGNAWWPDANLERELIKPQQAARYEADAWEQAIAEWLRTQPTHVTVLKVARDALFIEASKLGTADQRRISAALEQVGWMRNPDRGSHGERYWMAAPRAESAANV